MSALATLIDTLQIFPGIGERSARRMAYHVLQQDKAGAERLIVALRQALERIQHCALCHTLSETTPCATCADVTRDSGLLCVVQMPADQAAIERTGRYKGLYFVLLGALNPLDGIGPNALQLERLCARLQQNPPRELLLATNFTAEGELTAHVITQYCAAQLPQMPITRMTRGLPAGAELEYLDISTLAHALQARRPMV